MVLLQVISLHKVKRSKINISSRWIITTVIMSLALCTRMLIYLASSNASLVERVYSSTIYPYIGKALGVLSNIVPFSISEVALAIIIFFITLGFFLTISKPRFLLKNALTIFHYIIRFLAITYILFYFLWGFNYYREDYSVIANMTIEANTYEELKELTLDKIYKANTRRETLLENDHGIFFIDDDMKDLGRIANLGFDNYEVGNINLGGNYGKVKPVFLSKYMSYTGITGIYIPFTSEPNINIDVPHTGLLTTISHEIAHQRGFAKEDEANFIAYKANVNNPDERFQYSSYYFAMNQLLNEVYRQNKEDYILLSNEISDAVNRDLNYSREYWSSKHGKVREKATKMNDNYLKSNNQTEGVRSYNGVVQLLLAEYKDNL